MLEHLTGRVSGRKATLYVCAGLRRIWSFLYDDTSRRAVEVSERVADGEATEEEIFVAGYASESPTFGFDFKLQFIRDHMGDGNYSAGVRRLLQMGVFTEADLRGEERLGVAGVVGQLSHAVHIAYHCASGGNLGIGPIGITEHLLEHMSEMQAWPGGELVREVFGNPFRPVVIDPNWRTSTVIAIAEGAYQERAFDRLPILADALEDAYCDEVDVLAHLRGTGPHVLGCWALDLVLGKHTGPGV